MGKYGNTTFWIIFWLVFCAALFVDSLQWLVNLIPLAGIVLAKLLSIGAIMGFGLFLYTQGELDWKNGMWLLGFGTIEILPIPWLELLPAWTAGMATIMLKGRFGNKVPLVGKVLATGH